MKVPEFDKHLKKAGGHIGQNIVEITIKMKTISSNTQHLFVNALCINASDPNMFIILEDSHSELEF